MRAPTIFEKFYNSGSKIALVTAKDKLRTLLGNGLSFDDERAICFSAEKSDQATKDLNGIDNVNDWLGMPVPEVYSEGLSEFVMAAGVKLLEEFKPNIMYLSTTDYIQHKYAPGNETANKFYAMFDKYIGLLNKENVSIIISFATIYLEDKSKVDSVVNAIKEIKDIEVVLTKDEGCSTYNLPPDRMGDIICMSSEFMTIGSSEDKHNLSGLNEPLRSHGGLHEREVPFISNLKLQNLDTSKQLYNYDAFYYAINGAL